MVHISFCSRVLDVFTEVASSRRLFFLFSQTLFPTLAHTDYLSRFQVPNNYPMVDPSTAAMYQIMFLQQQQQAAAVAAAAASAATGQHGAIPIQPGNPMFSMNPYMAATPSAPMMMPGFYSPQPVRFVRSFGLFRPHLNSARIFIHRLTICSVSLF